MKHVVNFSGGACSFWAAKRVIDRNGPENVTLLFADVCMEDDDLYLFNAEAEEYFGVPITRVSLEMTPWDVFEKEGMIGNSRAPLCSIRLKRELLDAWHRKHCLEMDSIIYVGLDWTEGHRLANLRREHPTWRIEAPMMEEPIWDKCRMLDELGKIGIRRPRLYQLGFPHDNCGGFCVKAGQAQFALLLRTMPDRYAYHEAREERLRERIGDYSVMKDRRGGTVKPLTLRQLRQRIEAGESFDRTDWGGCGCSIDSPKEEKGP